uniref:Sugar phosphate transporter domain-containing protein n=2 Tax=Hemiselmis andersenii TaxID=464988 RepID=A0A7S0TTM9_HEMAN|mmetsp:Transcript_2087/g.5194  ORF Transcript_2087/g.5194 Transcript_2087/m.5194 type:complete len:477 (+) Transcript_2087:230-1660(+)
MLNPASSSGGVGGPSRMGSAASIGAYTLCSATMLVVSKLVVFHIPAPSFVASVQIVACICVLAVLHLAPFNSIKVESPTREIVVPYAVYSLLFALSIFTNFHALQHSNVETVIVFRSAAPMAVAFCDTLVLGREYPSLLSFFGIFLSFAGAIGYVLVDSQFSLESFGAYSWVASYYAVTVVIMTYGTYITSTVKLSLSGSVAYSNALSLPVLLALMVVFGEFSTLRNINFRLLLTTTNAFLWLLASCVVGTGISYAGWWCRSQISATSYTIVGVVNKALTIGLSSLIEWENTKTSTAGLLFLGIVVGGGAVFTQPPMRKPGESVTLCPSWGKRGQSSGGSGCRNRVCLVLVLGIASALVGLGYFVYAADISLETMRFGGALGAGPAYIGDGGVNRTWTNHSASSMDGLGASNLLRLRGESGDVTQRNSRAVNNVSKESSSSPPPPPPSSSSSSSLSSPSSSSSPLSRQRHVWLDVW